MCVEIGHYKHVQGPILKGKSICLSTAAKWHIKAMELKGSQTHIAKELRGRQPFILYTDQCNPTK